MTLECLVLNFFGCWCASRGPTLTHLDLIGGYGKGGVRQQDESTNNNSLGDIIIIDTKDCLEETIFEENNI